MSSWKTKRKMKARATNLVAARRAKLSAGPSVILPEPSIDIEPTAESYSSSIFNLAASIESTVDPTEVLVPTLDLEIEAGPSEPAAVAIAVEDTANITIGSTESEDGVPDSSAVTIEDAGVGSDTDYDSEPEEVFDDESAQAAFDNFMVTLALDDRRMLAVVLVESFRKRQSMSVMDAVQEAASIVGYSCKSVRNFRKEFWKNKGHLNERRQGKHERMTVYRDEEINRKAAEWVREKAFVKGMPNMTASSFCNWVNNTLLPSSHLPPHYPRHVSLRTAVRWLHHLGFKPMSHKKGVYIDGHEREDVVKHRKEYLKMLESLRHSHKPPPLCSDEPPRVREEEDETKKKLVLIYHDESIFNTNEGQSWMWGEDDRPAILPKTKGSGIMVSDFVDEHEGYLCLTAEQHEEAKRDDPQIPQSARVFLEYGCERDGYWTGERFMDQMKTACDLASFKYPHSLHTVVFVLDQSSCHKKFDDKALLARNILMKDGGPRKVRDTIWAGQPQSMVKPDGSAKGLRTVLTERGINTTTLKAPDMRTVLSFHEDFFTEKTQVEHYVINRGMRCFFLPKFHCELNPIERVWGQSKRYCRAHTNFTLIKLREILNPSLDYVDIELIRKYFRKCKDYEKAYLEGKKAGKEVERTVKLYKSHRRVFL